MARKQEYQDVRDNQQDSHPGKARDLLILVSDGDQHGNSPRLDPDHSAFRA
jgi:hypothetical protein